LARTSNQDRVTGRRKFRRRAGSQISCRARDSAAQETEMGDEFVNFRPTIGIGSDVERIDQRPALAGADSATICRVIEHFDPESRVRRAMQDARNVAAGARDILEPQDREILQVVGAGIIIEWVVGIRAGGAQVDPETAIAEDGVGRDSVAFEVRSIDRDTSAIVVGNDVSGLESQIIIESAARDGRGRNI
jgi:hypothetical protein